MMMIFKTTTLRRSFSNLKVLSQDTHLQRMLNPKTRDLPSINKEASHSLLNLDDSSEISTIRKSYVKHSKHLQAPL